MQTASREEVLEEEELDTNIAVPDFEGPLDLLLHLVKKHELVIFHIPIAFITAKYLQMIDTMRALNMDIAGEYLLMAATLAHIKSRELLPKDPDAKPEEEEDEGGDPRAELVRRLLEYQKYKQAAKELLDRPVAGRNVFPRGAAPLDVAGGTLDLTAPLLEVPVYELIEALSQVLSRSKVRFTHEVTLDRLSLADKINELTERLDREPSFTFESCFDWVAQVDAVIHLRGQIVVTFMAVLEMTRLKLMRVYQAETSGAIYITRVAAPAAGGAEGPAGAAADEPAQ